MSSLEQLTVSRVSGAQNTFFIVNTFVGPWNKVYSQLNKSQKQSLAKKLCGSFFGFQTDGLLFLKEEKPFDFVWDFYNSDGSFAEMCGNAARCASLYYFERINSKKHIHFSTGAGDISADIIDKQIVKVEMSKISVIQKMNVLNTAGILVDTGVPHFVIEKSPDRDLAKKLRQVSDFGKSGANITFVENLSDKSIQAVTFERGVEDYTQACGTGAVAAAIYFQEQRGSREEVSVFMPGGELKVQNAKPGQRPFLIGPAIIEFDLSFNQTLVGEL